MYKSALLHHRCLMPKFTEMLMLVCTKIFSAFYPTLHESVSNSYGFALLQEFNIFYLRLVLYDRKHFVQSWLIGATIYFCFIKENNGREACSYQTVSKNVETAVRKGSSEAVTRRCSVKKLFLEISQNSQENTCSRVSLLLKLQVKVCNFI